MNNTDLIAEARRNAPESVDESLIMRLVIALEAKPRVITNIEGINALPVGSVILDRRGISLHNTRFFGWVSSTLDRDIDSELLEREALPATVLHEPEAEAAR